MIFQKQIEKAYKDQLFTRQDETKDIFYFSAKDFDGLQQRAFSFSAIEGHTLQGCFYHYDAPTERRVIIFDHGMGCGHRAYMKEIEMLARHGYLVFAYDHTGCAESAGESTGGFAQSLSDLDACITALKNDEEYSDLEISVVGHSWGAFAAMNICAIHPEITHIVAISGFISVGAILSQNFSGPLSLFYKPIYELEKASNPRYVHYRAEESLKGTDAKVLIIHSTDDKIVKAANHYNILRYTLTARPNVRFLTVNHKGHNPNYTVDAVDYKDAFFAELKEKRKKKLLASDEEKELFAESFDWHRMTAQDDKIWAEIFRTLDA